MPIAASPRPLTGWKVLLILVAFFGAVIAVNVVMADLAISTLPGTDVESPWQAGLNYEKQAAAARAQDARHWQVDAHIQRTAQGGAMLQVEARDRNGAPLSGLTFIGRLERPTDEHADLTLKLREVGAGIYRGRAAAVAPGQWKLVLKADASGRRMFLSTNRVMLN
jgi:nitrogen fixation protein FixH